MNVVSCWLYLSYKGCYDAMQIKEMGTNFGNQSIFFIKLIYNHPSIRMFKKNP